MPDAGVLRAGEAAELYWSAIATAHNAYVATDEDGVVVAWNAAAERMFGFPESQAVGGELPALIASQSDRSAFLADFRRCGESGESGIPDGRLEFSAVRRDGGVFAAEMTVSVVPGPAGPIFHAFIADISDRVAADADRRLLSLVVQCSQDAIVTTDTAGVITSWNGGAERLYGYSGSEMVGQVMLPTNAPAPAVEEAQERLGRLLAGEWITAGAVPRERKDGEVIFVALSAAPLRDATGEVIGVASIARDVSDERRLSVQLAETEERQRLLLGNLPDTMVGLFDRDLRCLLLQGPILQRAGIDVADFVGRPIQETLPAAQVQQLEPLIRRALQGEAGAVEYYSALSELTYDLDVAPYRAADGTVAGAFVVGRDITERLSRELEMRRLASVVEQSAEAIMTKALDGTITGWNHAAERLYGYSAKEAVGQPLSILVPAERAGEEIELLARVLDGEPVTQLQTSRVRKDGTIFEVSITVSLIRDPAGEPVGASVHTRDITTQRRAERELRDQARLLAESQSATHVGSWEWDLGGHQLVWSDELCRIFGRELGFSPTVDELIGMVHPDDRQALSAGMAAARGAAAANSDYQYRIVRPDGEVRYALGRRFARTNQHGEVTHLFGTLQDVTELREAEDERERAAGQLRDAQRIARIGSWWWDPEADAATWSEEMYRIFSRDPSQGPATSGEFFACVAAEDRERLTAGYKQMFGGGMEFELDYRIVSSDGTRRVVHALGRQDPERAGHYVGTVQDVTELRGTERALREAEQQFRKALVFAPIGMALVSPEGRWLQVNRAVCELVGYNEQELLELTFQDITHPDDRDADQELIRELLAGKIPSYRIQKRYLHRSGAVVWAQLSVSLIRDDDGSPVHLIAQIQDVSAEKVAREALEASEQRYQAIAANVPGMVYRLAMSPDGELSLPFVSAGCHEILGVSPAQLMADVSIAVNGVHPDDRSRFTDSLAASAEHLTRWDWHGRQVVEGGEMKDLHATAQPTRELDGSTLWDGVILDETEIRRAQRREAESKQRLELILENLAGSAVALYDQQLRLRFCEGPLFAHLDMTQMMGRPLPELVSDDVMKTVAPGLHGALQGTVSTAVLDADREGRTLAIQFAPYRLADGTIDGALVHWHDISAVRSAERQRDEALEQFQVAFERAPIGMAIVGLDGSFQRVNEALCEITGYPGEDLLAMAPFATVEPEDLDHVQQQFTQIGVRQDSTTFEHRIAHAAGHPVWVQYRVTLIRDANDQPLHLLTQVQDISDRRGYEDSLRHLADHDSLTGLLNRRGLEASLEAHLAHCRRYGSAGALLMLDLDGFKFVNDTLGHAVGDQLLIDCAHALTSRLRETDTIARLGGDEFAILLPCEDQPATETVARALIQTVREHTASMANDPVRVTASIGVAMFTEPNLNAEEMLIAADLAMYDAKDAGRDRYACTATTDTSSPGSKAR